MKLSPNIKGRIEIAKRRARYRWSLISQSAKNSLLALRDIRSNGSARILTNVFFGQIVGLLFAISMFLLCSALVSVGGFIYSHPHLSSSVAGGMIGLIWSVHDNPAKQP